MANQESIQDVNYFSETFTLQMDSLIDDAEKSLTFAKMRMAWEMRNIHSEKSFNFAKGLLLKIIKRDLYLYIFGRLMKQLESYKQIPMSRHVFLSLNSIARNLKEALNLCNAVDLSRTWTRIRILLIECGTFDDSMDEELIKWTNIDSKVHLLLDESFRQQIDNDCLYDKLEKIAQTSVFKSLDSTSCAGSAAGKGSAKKIPENHIDIHGDLNSTNKLPQTPISAAKLTVNFFDAGNDSISHANFPLKSNSGEDNLKDYVAPSKIQLMADDIDDICSPVKVSEFVRKYENTFQPSTSTPGRSFPTPKNTVSSCNNLHATADKPVFLKSELDQDMVDGNRKKRGSEDICFDKLQLVKDDVDDQCADPLIRVKVLDFVRKYENAFQPKGLMPARKGLIAKRSMSSSDIPYVNENKINVPKIEVSHNEYRSYTVKENTGDTHVEQPINVSEFAQKYDQIFSRMESPPEKKYTLTRKNESSNDKNTNDFQNSMLNSVIANNSGLNAINEKIGSEFTSTQNPRLQSKTDENKFVETILQVKASASSSRSADATVVTLKVAAHNSQPENKLTDQKTTVHRPADQVGSHTYNSANSYKTSNNAGDTTSDSNMLANHHDWRDVEKISKQETVDPLSSPSRQNISNVQMRSTIGPNFMEMPNVSSPNITSSSKHSTIFQMNDVVTPITRTEGSSKSLGETNVSNINENKRPNPETVTNFFKSCVTKDTQSSTPMDETLKFFQQAYEFSQLEQNARINRETKTTVEAQERSGDMNSGPKTEALINFNDKKCPAHTTNQVKTLSNGFANIRLRRVSTSSNGSDCCSTDSIRFFQQAESIFHTA